MRQNVDEQTERFRAKKKDSLTDRRLEIIIKKGRPVRDGRDGHAVYVCGIV